MCLGEDLTFEDCDKACTGPSCHNVDCDTPMLYPGTVTSPSERAKACTGPACRVRLAAKKASVPHVHRHVHMSLVNV